MSILQSNPSTTARVISPEAEAKLNANILLSSAKTNYQLLSRIQKEGIKKVWNAESATPQQVCDALGNKAAKLFEFHAALTQCIVAIATKDGIQPDIALPTHAFTKNEDGTVTVSDQPYQP